MNEYNTVKDIILSLENRYIPDEDRADYEAIFHFYISGDEGGEYTAHIENNECKVSEGIEGEATCEIKCKDSVYKQIELGEINAQMAFMLGKIKISNIGAMMKFIEMFERLH